MSLGVWVGSRTAAAAAVVVVVASVPYRVEDSRELKRLSGSENYNDNNDTERECGHGEFSAFQNTRQFKKQKNIH